jgi:hypothetical protein
LDKHNKYSENFQIKFQVLNFTLEVFYLLSFFLEEIRDGIWLRNDKFLLLRVGRESLVVFSQTLNKRLLKERGETLLVSFVYLSLCFYDHNLLNNKKF